MYAQVPVHGFDGGQGFLWASLVAQSVKHLRPMWETQDRSLGWEDPLEKEYSSTPVLLPGKSHGLRSLVGYSPWGRKESDTTERLHFTSGFSLELTAIQVACHTACHLLLQSSNNTWFPPSSLFLLVICLGCHLVQCPGFRELSPTARQGAEPIQEASEMTETTWQRP